MERNEIYVVDSITNKQKYLSHKSRFWLFLFFFAKSCPFTHYYYSYFKFIMRFYEDIFFITLSSRKKSVQFAIACRINSNEKSSGILNKFLRKILAAPMAILRLWARILSTVLPWGRSHESGAATLNAFRRLGELEDAEGPSVPGGHAMFIVVNGACNRALSRKHVITRTLNNRLRINLRLSFYSGWWRVILVSFLLVTSTYLSD